MRSRLQGSADWSSYHSARLRIYVEDEWGHVGCSHHWNETATASLVNLAEERSKINVGDPSPLCYSGLRRGL